MKKGGNARSEQEVQTPLRPVPNEASTSSTSTLNTLMHDQLSLKGEIADMKRTLAEERELNAKRHEDLMSTISALTAKFSSPSSSSI